MTRIYTPPDQRRQIADLGRRVGALERRITPAGRAAASAPAEPEAPAAAGLYLRFLATFYPNDTNYSRPISLLVDPTFGEGEGFSAYTTTVMGPVPAAGSSRFTISIAPAPAFTDPGSTVWAGWRLHVANADCSRVFLASASVAVDPGGGDFLPAAASWTVNQTLNMADTLSAAGSDVYLLVEDADVYWATLWMSIENYGS